MGDGYLPSNLAVPNLEICDHLAPCPRRLPIFGVRRSVRVDDLQQFLGFNSWEDDPIEQLTELPCGKLNRRRHVL